MRRLLIALCLLAGPAFAQDDSLLPPDGGLDEAFDEMTGAPNAAFVATIRGVLQDSAAQGKAVGLALGRLRAPETVQAMMREHLAALLADKVVQTGVAEELAFAFDDFGMTPSNADVITRLAGDQLLLWGEYWLFAGLAALPLADQQAGLGLHLRFAEGASAQDCADYLSDTQDYGRTWRMRMEIMAGWPEAEARAALALLRRAMLAEAAGTEPADLEYTELSQVDLTAGTVMMRAVDAVDDPARLWAAFGYAEQATAEDICAVRLTMLRAVQGMTGDEGALAQRYVMLYGLNE